MLSRVIAKNVGDVFLRHSVEPQDVITLRRSAPSTLATSATASGVQACCSGGVQGTEQPSTRIPVAGLPACRRHPSAQAPVVTQLHLCERYHKHTVWRSCVRCRWTTTLEQFASRCPSDRRHSRNFLPEVEDVFVWSRRQHLATVVFRRCV